MTSKACFKCAIVKPLDEFYKHPQMGDGHLGKCKECARNDVREHRAANIEKVRAYDNTRASLPHRVAARNDYQRTEAGKEAHRKALKTSRQRFPHKYAARCALGNAVRDGKVVPLPCWVCGEKAQGHHPDYNSPLDVVWLCRSHHKQAHALVRT